MDQAVLVTGCSSGLGLAIARHVAERGATVYATVRREAAAERLARMRGVEALVCDVTDEAQVARLRESVEARGRGLWGLVNNAGVAHVGRLTGTSVSEMKDVFEVNVFGAHRVTNAVVELIVASGGRIVNVSSVSGTLSGPRLGVYSMTKHALEAYTDALAGELAAAGVHVAAIEPGNYASAIAANALGRTAPPGAAGVVRRLGAATAGAAWSALHGAPDEVARACLEALFAPAPLRRYLVTPDARTAIRTLTKAAEELVQLNRYSAHRLTREDLSALVARLAAERS